MNPLAYSLCQKSGLGLAMFVAGLCAFPPLFLHEPLSLQTADATLVKEFKAPVSKPYFLELDFDFPATAAIRDYGQPIPIHVLIRNRRGNTVVTDQTFVTPLYSGVTNGPTQRTLARLELSEGEYVVEMRNLEAHHEFDGARTTVSLVAGHGK